VTGAVKLLLLGPVVLKDITTYFAREVVVDNICPNLPPVKTVETGKVVKYINTNL
jgi:hypothetical protein